MIMECQLPVVPLHRLHPVYSCSKPERQMKQHSEVIESLFALQFHIVDKFGSFEMPCCHFHIQTAICTHTHVKSNEIGCCACRNWFYNSQSQILKNILSMGGQQFSPQLRPFDIIVQLIVKVVIAQNSVKIPSFDCIQIFTNLQE